MEAVMEEYMMAVVMGARKVVAVMETVVAVVETKTVAGGV